MPGSLPADAHTSRPWRIHEIARGFRLEDVWALPAHGGPDDFPRLVEQFRSFDPAEGSSVVVRSLFEIRRRLGDVLGLDRPQDGLAARVPSLRERLPEDLRDAPPPPGSEVLPFTPLYMTDDEWAIETANRTVHGVLHLGWVADGSGDYHGQLAVLVRRNGLLGAAYMAAIAPFRHLLVYPALMRDLERGWGTT